MEYSIKHISKKDYPFLKDMLYDTLFVAPGKEAYPRTILELPELSQYYKDWGIFNDFGFIALDEEISFGAIWGRQFPKEKPGYGFINEYIHEIAIALKPKYRNKGLGTELMLKFFDLARSLSLEYLSLAVDKLNPAARLYRRLGFELVKETDEDFIMKKKL